VTEKLIKPSNQNQTIAEHSDILVFEHEKSGNREILILKGEVTRGDSESVYQEIMELFADGITEVLLDLRKLEYVDTTGLQNLVKVYKHIESNPDLDFKILVQDGELRNILQTCRFDRFIDITADSAVCKNPW